MSCTLDWRKCKQCGEFFDIDTHFELCPACRNKKKGEEEDGTN